MLKRTKMDSTQAAIAIQRIFRGWNMRENNCYHLICGCCDSPEVLVAYIIPDRILKTMRCPSCFCYYECGKECATRVIFAKCPGKTCIQCMTHEAINAIVAEALTQLPIMKI
jgi:hypothetical protein